MTSNTNPEAHGANAEASDVEAFAAKLFDLARSGDANLLGQYIEHGVDVNLTNHQGNTLLMLAAYSGNTEAVRRLTALGADVNALNDRGQSPLAGALFKQELEIARLLLDAGANPDLGHPNARDTVAMFGMDFAFE